MLTAERRLSVGLPFAERDDQTQARLDERLIRAAERGCVKSIQRALTLGADISAMDETGVQAVHSSASGGHVEALRSLLEAGAKPGARDFMQWTPMHEAAVKGQTAVVEFLIKEVGVEVDSQEGTGSTPLHAAASLGKVEMCQYLIQQGADIEALDVCGFTPLHQAATEGNIEVCQLLLGAGADIDSRNHQKRTPLASAAAAGHLETVQMLAGFPTTIAREIKSGMVEVIHNDLRILPRDVSFLVSDFAVPLCDLGQKDVKGMTPVDLAEKRGHKEIVDFLLPLLPRPIELKEETGLGESEGESPTNE